MYDIWLVHTYYLFGPCFSCKHWKYTSTASHIQYNLVIKKAMYAHHEVTLNKTDNFDLGRNSYYDQMSSFQLQM